jgi:hypothetical protein
VDDPRATRSFGEQSVPEGLAIPRWLAIGVAATVAIGIAVAFASVDGPKRIAAASFFAALYSYIFLSLADFAEHYRLERIATGSFFTFRVVPPGESLNHTATVATILVFLLGARPLPAALEPRDWAVLAAPAIFLVLGWRDEAVYHRRRSVHREDMLHTVSHLAAGVMMVSFALYRLA